MWPLLYVWDNTVTFLLSLSACWIKWRAIFELSVTAWQHSYIVRVTPILSSLPPSWLLKCVAGGRKQTARVWLTFISEHLHTLQLFTNLLGIFYFLVHLWNIFQRGLDFSFSCWKKMALRQDSDKEPRIELFIKVSCSSFKFELVGYLNSNKVSTFFRIVGSNIKYKNIIYLW